MSHIVDRDRLQMQDVELLVDLVAQSAVQEVTVQVGECRVTVRKATVYAASLTNGHQPAPKQSESLAVPTDETPTMVDSTPTAPVSATHVKTTAIEAPLVGVFHTALTPIHEGAKITVGDVVGQIESMKLMNEVRAELSGKVLEVLAEDGSPVQYGQPLFIVEEDAS